MAAGKGKIRENLPVTAAEDVLYLHMRFIEQAVCSRDRGLHRCAKMVGKLHSDKPKITERQGGKQQMIRMYYHAGSENHGCEAIVRATNKILSQPLNLFSMEPEGIRVCLLRHH